LAQESSRTQDWLGTPHLDKMAKLVAALLLLAPAVAEIAWDTTFGKDPARRLANQLANSHTDASDPACIVGGYDSAFPTRFYVGGPCSLLTRGVPQDGFRYFYMETIFADLTDPKGKSAQMAAYTSASDSFQYSRDLPTHTEIGTGLNQHFTDTDISDAAMFVSTTTYLSKSTFKFSTNDFLVDSTGKMFENVCVAQCAGTLPASCTSCPAANSSQGLDITPGKVKFSILAAAYDNGPKGWQTVKTKHPGQSGELEGFFNVYQAIDFSNMAADTLILGGPQGTVTYSDMRACNMATMKDDLDANQDCHFYNINSVEVQSAGWKSSLAFPTTYNRGRWNQAGATAPNNVITANANQVTKTVNIRGVKPSGIKTKAIYLQYQFDVTGIEASGRTFPMWGEYIVYDPSITTVDPNAPTASGLTDGAESKNVGLLGALGIALVMLWS